jgi:hypothetical protein
MLGLLHPIDPIRSHPVQVPYARRCIGYGTNTPCVLPLQSC